MPENALRRLPSIDQLLRRENLQPLIAEAGRDAVRDRLREVIGELRQEFSFSDAAAAGVVDENQLSCEIERRLQQCFVHRQQLRTRRVINATGVVLHTNLGRAPLSRAALAAITEAAGEYCNLEYDLETGQRGKRGAGLEATLREIVGCQSAAVVNNCAAAVLITLNTLAEGGEVIVSRGELIEIGGSFRIPDVIAKSGARLREVGTTNRTRLSDYEQAINEHTKVILRAHPSNYRIVGFTEKPSLTELAQLARYRSLPLFEDLGSGSLLDLNSIGVRDEPTVGHSIDSGVSVTAFSGDKLLGGPQSGIILGEADLIKRIKANPLMRALRVDKLTYAALEATIAAYAAGRAVQEIPTLAALHLTKESIELRARAFIQKVDRFGDLKNKLRLELIEGSSVIGGGSAPEAQLPTMLIGVSSPSLTAVELEAKLRAGSPPVIARIFEDQLVFDLRTVPAEREEELMNVLKKGLGDRGQEVGDRGQEAGIRE